MIFQNPGQGLTNHMCKLKVEKANWHLANGGGRTRAFFTK